MPFTHVLEPEGGRPASLYSPSGWRKVGVYLPWPSAEVVRYATAYPSEPKKIPPRAAINSRWRICPSRHLPPCHTPPFHTPPCHTPSRHTPPFHTPSRHTPPFHTPPFHLPPCHTPPCHTPSRHTPPCHTPSR